MAEMSKTPEEIKKGLECCKPLWKGDHWKTCDQKCPYTAEGTFCKNILNSDALALIQRLEAQNAELVRKTEQLQRERDAAVKILTDIVHINEWFGDIDICSACKKDNCKECRRCNEGFEWRGVQEQEG